MIKKKLTIKQVRLIISVLSVVIFAFSYLYIYSTYTQKAADALAEAIIIKQQITKLNDEKANEEIILSDTDDINKQIDGILDSYPVYIAKEDNLMFLEQLEKAVGVVIPSISISDSTIFYTSVIPARAEKDSEEGTAVSATTDEFMTALQSSISISFQTTYKGFKELTKYITNYPGKAIIDSASISYDSSTGELTGSMMLYRYALTGTGKVYEPPYVGDIGIGTDNIFGTSGK